MGYAEDLEKVLASLKKRHTQGNPVASAINSLQGNLTPASMQAALSGAMGMQPGAAPNYGGYGTAQLMPFSPAGGAQGGSVIDRVMSSLRQLESGGRYDAVNSKDPLGGAQGAYQILAGNFVNPGGWDKEALGKDITLQDFMANPQIQDQIARHKVGQYLDQYGVQGVPLAWNGGPGAVGNPSERVRNYQNKFMSIFGGGSAPTQPSTNSPSSNSGFTSAGNPGFAVLSSIGSPMDRLGAINRAPVAPLPVIAATALKKKKPKPMGFRKAFDL